MLYLFVEEVVSQMVEDHGIGGVYGVCLRQKLHAILDGVLGLTVQFQDG